MHYLLAFLVGGAFCAAAQILIDKTHMTPARILVTYVVCGVVLSAVGLYGPLADAAGCGATVPIIGFGHLLAQGVKEAIDERGAIGILIGGLSGASAGITAVMTFSLLAAFLFRGKRR